MEVLVLYYSKTQTTRRISEKIADRLKSLGIPAIAMDMTDEPDLSLYNTVIIGAPINGMRLAVEATNTLQKLDSKLQGKQIAMFYVSYMLDNCREKWQGAIQNATKPFESTLHPKLTYGFYGRIEKQLPAPMRFVFGTDKSLALDRTDGKQIDEFIQKFTQAFQ